MKIGIVVYSHTGNTLSVAQKLQEALAAKGHAAKIERVEAVVSDPREPGPVALKSAPDVAPYDALVFACPVHAFSLPAVMKLYLKGISSLSGKKVSCFVTQGLKRTWMGGNHTVRQMKSACRAKGAILAETAVVNWPSEQRERQIADLLTRLSAV